MTKNLITLITVLVTAIGLSGCTSSNPDGVGTKPVGSVQKAAPSKQEKKDKKLGTRENPVPVGQKVKIGEDWNVTVKSVNQNADAAVKRANQFNDPPATGRHFVLAALDVTYVGTKSGTPWTDLMFKFYGPSGNTFGASMETDYCGVIPNSLTDKGEMFPNASVQGNICVSVPSAQIAGGSFIGEETIAMDNSRVFFAVK